MSNVRITGMTVVDKEPNEHGFRILAYFECKLWSLRLVGCTMLVSPEGDLRVSPPRIPGPLGERKAIHITDENLRERLIAKALPVYWALGGTWKAETPPLAGVRTANTRSEVVSALLNAGAPIATRGGRGSADGVCGEADAPGAGPAE